ncbi:MAG: WG repeat-containing protein, partial [Lewinella sp.]|nr:WG repeat-containing protein [Lewinella sp.]
MANYPIFARTMEKGQHRYIIRHAGRYGYCNEDGEVIVAPQYLAAEDYQENMTLVELIDRWVPLDWLGRPLLKQLFREIFPYHNGRARVQLASNWGFIDTAGEMVIPCRYEQANDFHEGLAPVQE